jgi:alkylation response protein AidB-like acyl-CoA dehydrogenase
MGLALSAYEEGVAYAKQKTHRGQPITSSSMFKSLLPICYKYEAAKLYLSSGLSVENSKDPMVLVKEAAVTKAVLVEAPWILQDFLGVTVPTV